MVKDQQEAEKQKVAGQELQEQLEAQEVVIKQKREDVMKDLSKVEPAVQDAQNGLEIYRVFASFLMIFSDKILTC